MNTDPLAKQIAKVFAQSIAILDRSELLVRDEIERSLADVAGIDTNVSSAMAASDACAARVSAIRAVAIKSAFKHLETNLPQDEWSEENTPQLEEVIFDVNTA